MNTSDINEFLPLGASCQQADIAPLFENTPLACIFSLAMLAMLISRIIMAVKGRLHLKKKRLQKQLQQQQAVLGMDMDIVDIPSVLSDDLNMSTILEMDSNVDDYEYYQSRAKNPENIYIAEIV